MNDIIVINSYPDTREREVILKNCIKQFKKTNKHILLATHYPVKRETQQLVDYFIYDKNNPMLDESILYWYGNDNFYLQTESRRFGEASFAGLLSIQNAISLAKHLDKKIFYYFEYDCLISDKDLQNIELLKNKVYRKGKRGHIQLDTHGGDIKNEGVNMLFFMLEVDFYYENFSMLKTYEEYKRSVKYGVALEFYLYQGLYKNISQLDVKRISFLKEIFPNSHFNFSSYESPHFIDILSEQKSRKSILVITNEKNDRRDYRISFLKKNNTTGEAEVSVLKGGYYYNILSEDIKNIKVFYKENRNWKLIYDKIPHIEAKNKKDFEYVRIT